MGTYGQKTVDVSVNLTLNEEGTISKLKEIQKALQEVQSVKNLKINTTGFKSLNKDVNSFANSVETLLQKMDKLSTKFMSIKDEQAKTSKGKVSKSTSDNLDKQVKQLEKLREAQSKLEDDTLSTKLKGMDKDKNVIQDAYQNYTNALTSGKDSKKLATARGKLSGLWEEFQDKYSDMASQFDSKFVSVTNASGKTITKSLGEVGRQIDKDIASYTGKYEDVIEDAEGSVKSTDLPFDLPSSSTVNVGGAKRGKSYNASELSKAIEDQEKVVEEAYQKYNQELSGGDSYFEKLLNLSSGKQEVPIKFKAEGTEEIDSLVQKIQELPNALKNVDLSDVMSLADWSKQIESAADQVDALATRLNDIGIGNSSKKKSDNNANTLSGLTNEDIADIEKQTKSYTNGHRKINYRDISLDYKNKIANSLKGMGVKDSYTDSDFKDIISVFDGYQAKVKRFNNGVRSDDTTTKKLATSLDDAIADVSKFTTLKDAGFTEDKLKDIATQAKSVYKSYEKAKSSGSSTSKEKTSVESETDASKEKDNDRTIEYKLDIDTSELDSLKSSISKIADEPISIKLKADESSLSDIKSNIENLLGKNTKGTAVSTESESKKIDYSNFMPTKKTTRQDSNKKIKDLLTSASKNGSFEELGDDFYGSLTANIKNADKRIRSNVSNTKNVQQKLKSSLKNIVPDNSIDEVASTLGKGIDDYKAKLEKATTSTTKSSAKTSSESSTDAKSNATSFDTSTLSASIEKARSELESLKSLAQESFKGIVLELDTSKAQSSINELKTAIKEMSELSKSSTSVKSITGTEALKSAKETAEAQKALESNLQDILFNNKSKGLDSEYASLSESLSKMGVNTSNKKDVTKAIKSNLSFLEKDDDKSSIANEISSGYRKYLSNNGKLNSNTESSTSGFEITPTVNTKSIVSEIQSVLKSAKFEIPVTLQDDSKALSKQIKSVVEKYGSDAKALSKLQGENRELKENAKELRKNVEWYKKQEKARVKQAETENEAKEKASTAKEQNTSKKAKNTPTKSSVTSDDINANSEKQITQAETGIKTAQELLKKYQTATKELNSKKNELFARGQSFDSKDYSKALDRYESTRSALSNVLGGKGKNKIDKTSALGKQIQAVLDEKDKSLEDTVYDKLTSNKLSKNSKYRDFSIDKDSLKIDDSGMASFIASVTKANGEVETLKMNLSSISSLNSNSNGYIKNGTLSDSFFDNLGTNVTASAKFKASYDNELQNYTRAKYKSNGISSTIESGIESGDLNGGDLSQLITRLGQVQQEADEAAASIDSLISEAKSLGEVSYSEIEQAEKSFEELQNTNENYKNNKYSDTSDNAMSKFNSLLDSYDIKSDGSLGENSVLIPVNFKVNDSEVESIGQKIQKLKQEASDIDLKIKSGDFDESTVDSLLKEQKSKLSEAESLTKKNTKGLDYVGTVDRKNEKYWSDIQDQVTKKIESEYPNARNIKFKGAKATFDDGELTYQTTANIKALNEEQSVLNATTKATGQYMTSGQKFASNVQSKFKSITEYLTGLQAAGQVMRQIQEGFSTVSTIDSQLTNINKTMGVTAEQLNEVKTASVDMGVSLGKSSTEVLDAVSIYANANETATSIVEKAKPTVMLSNASGADTSTAADQIQGVVNQFSELEGQETRIVNSYEKISAGLGIDFAKGITIMSEGVSNAGSVADQAGLSFEQFAASVGKVSEKTRAEGSTIGNAYKTILARTSRSTSADEDVTAEERSNASKALSSIGIDVYDENGEYQDFSTTLDQLSSKWDGLSDATKAYVSEQMAGVRNLNTMTAIIETWQDAKELANDATTDTDFIDETQEKHMESLEGRIETMKASLEEMWVNVLNTDVLQNGISALTKVLEIINKILESIGKVGDAFGNIPLLGNAGSLLKTLSTAGIGGLLYSGLESKRENGSFLEGMLTPIKGTKDIISGFINQLDIFNDRKSSNSNSSSSTNKSENQSGQTTVSGVEVRSRLASALNGAYRGLKSDKSIEKSISEAESTLAENTGKQVSKVIENSTVGTEIANSIKSNKSKIDSSSSNSDVIRAAENSYASIDAEKYTVGTKAISKNLENAVKSGEDLNYTYGSLKNNLSSFTSGLTVASKAVETSGSKLNSIGNGIRGFIQGFTGVEGALSGVSGTTIAAVSGLAVAAASTVAAIKLLNSSTEETSSKAEEATETFETQRTELQNNKSTISEYKGELANLISGVSKAGKNISLSTDEFSRFHEICNDIADKFPSLVKGYDSEGNAILNLSSNLSELDDAYNSVAIKNANSNLKNLSTYKENLQNAMGNKSTGTTADDLTNIGYWWRRANNNTTEDDYGSSSPKQVKAVLEKLQGMSYSDFQDYQKQIFSHKTSSDEKAAYEYLSSSNLLNFSNVKNKSDWKEVLSQIPGQIQTQQSKIDEAAEGVRTSMQSLLDVMCLDSSEYPEFKGISSKLKDNLDTLFSSMDAETLSGISDPTSYVSNMLKKFKKNPTAENDLNDLLNYDSTGKSIDQQESYIKNRLSSVADALGYKLNKNGTNSKLMDMLGLGDVNDALEQYQKIKDSYVTGKSNKKNSKSSSKDSDNESSNIMEKYSNGFTTSNIDQSQIKKNSKLLDENTKSNKKNSKATEEVTNSEEEQASRLQKLNQFIAAHNIGTADELRNLKKLMSQYQKAGDVDWDALSKDYDYKAIDLSANETALEKLESNIETVTNNLSTLQSARTKSVSSTGMDTSDIESVESIFGSLDGYNHSKLFESTSAGIKMNVQELSKLNEEYKSSEIKKYTDEIDKLKTQYKAACQEAGDLSKSATEVNEALSKRDSLKSQLESAYEKKAQIEGQTNAVAEWERAVSGSEIGDTYDSIYSNGISGAQARWEKGEVGTNEFQSFVKMFSDPNADYSGYTADDYANLYEGAMAKAQRYFTEDAREGAQNYLTDLHNVNEELASLDDEGHWKISGNIEDLASAMGISEGATEAMIEKLQALGFTIDQTQESDYLKQTREDAQATYDALDQATKDNYGINMDADDLEGIDEQIENIDKAIEEAGDNEGLKDQLQTIKDYYEALKGEKMESLVDPDSAEGIQKLQDGLSSLKEKLGENFKFDIDWGEDDSDYYTKKKKELTNQLNNTDVMSDGKWNTNADGFQEAYNQYSAIRKKQQEIENGNNAAFKFDTSNLTDASKKVVEDQQSIIQALQNNKNLKEDVEMGVEIDSSTVNESTSSVIDQIRSYCQANNIEIPVDADCSAAQTSVNAISEWVQGLDNEEVKVQVQAEVDSDNSAEEKLTNIKNILEENGIEIPVEIEQQSLNEQLSTLEEAFNSSNSQKWLKKNTETNDSSENESTASVKIDGADDANSKLDELNSKLEEFSGDYSAKVDVETDKAESTMSNLNTDKKTLSQPTTMQFNANGSQAQSTVSNLKSSKTTLQNPLTMLINAAGNALSQTNQIKSAKAGIQSPASFLVSVIGGAIGTLQQIIGQKQAASTPGSIAMNVSGDAEGTLSSIMGLVQQTDSESADPSVTAVDNASGILSSIIGLLGSITSKTVTVTVNKVVNTSGGDDADGTANLEGTAHASGNAFASGSTTTSVKLNDNNKKTEQIQKDNHSTEQQNESIKNKTLKKLSKKSKPNKKPKSNKAYARGTWGASNGGLSLMGELGREIVVMRAYIVIYM